MREVISLAIFFLSWKVLGGINDTFLAFSIVISFCAILYFAGCIMERVVMKTSTWFRITPGMPQIPPMDDIDETNKPDKPDKSLDEY